MVEVSLANSIKNLLNHISPRRKIQFLFLSIFTIFAGLLEILSIASIVPFTTLVTDNSYTTENLFISKFVLIKDKQHAIIILGMVFASLYLFNSITRVILIYITARLSKTVTAELSINIYKATLYNSYANHIKLDSNSIISSISQKVYSIASLISGIINIISGTFISICIIGILITINPQIMIVSILFFSFLYSAVVLMSRKSINNSSYIINKEQNNIIKNLQNGLGAIRDIILDKTQNFYLKIFEKASFLLARKISFLEFVQNSPRYILEGLGIVLFVILLIYWSETRSETEFLLIFPTLAALAIGAQRILPLMNIIYSNLTIVRGTYHQLNEVIDILNKYLISEKQKEKITQKNVEFKNSIIFKNVSFSYDNNNFILDDVNIEIKKGLKIGIVGKTGEGKSTFLDLLMGLLEPQKGSIYIDKNKLSKETNYNWQSKISHVPQKIFLSDSSYLENIAFGIDIKKINHSKVETAAKKSQIHDFIFQTDKGYNQNVGERGIKLSGGQIQRIGLARALYKSSEIIIFDEATNSLDNFTEKLVMRELFNLDKDLTIIIVAHRLNTLQECDQIFEVKDKKIIMKENKKI